MLIDTPLRPALGVDLFATLLASRIKSRADDTWDRINYPKMEKIVRLV